MTLPSDVLTQTELSLQWIDLPTGAEAERRAFLAHQRRCFRHAGDAATQSKAARPGSSPLAA